MLRDELESVQAKAGAVHARQRRSIFVHSLGLRVRLYRQPNADNQNNRGKRRGNVPTNKRSQIQKSQIENHARRRWLEVRSITIVKFIDDNY